jgi:hypothetical protein
MSLNTESLNKYIFSLIFVEISENKQEKTSIITKSDIIRGFESAYLYYICINNNIHEQFKPYSHRKNSRAVTL